MPRIRTTNRRRRNKWLYRPLNPLEAAIRKWRPGLNIDRDTDGFGIFLDPSFEDAWFRYHSEKYQSVSIYVEHGDCSDFIFDDEVTPVKTQRGWKCTLCLEPIYHKSLYDLWVNHLFEPLFKFLEEKLNRSEGLGFYGHNGATWVKLGLVAELEEDTENLVFIRPLAEYRQTYQNGREHQRRMGLYRNGFITREEVIR